MKVYTSLEDFTHIDDAVLTLGMFDGVHLAHREILEVLKRKARELEGISVVLTFSPHPREVLSRKRFPLITTDREKQELLDDAFVDIWCRVPFTPAFAALSPEALIDRLHRKMNIRHIVLGYDHNFGHQRKGGIHTLDALKETYGFGISEVPQLKVQGTPVSSSAVRDALQQGDIRQAETLLGHPYFAFAEDIEKKDAHCLNIRVPAEKMLPMPGDYNGLWKQENIQIHITENQQMLLYFDRDAPAAVNLIQHPIYWKSL